MPVASQEIEQLCMCVLGVLRLSMIYLMDFGTVPTVWYFLVFHLTILQNIYGSVWFRFMVFNATFNYISVISWQSVLLVEETEVHGENH